MIVWAIKSKDGKYLRSKFTHDEHMESPEHFTKNLQYADIFPQEINAKAMMKYLSMNLGDYYKPVKIEINELKENN